MGSARSSELPPPDAERCPPGTLAVLKRESGRAVYLVRDDDGSRALLKCWPLHPWEVVKCCLGIAQPQRQLRGSRRLRAAGVATPAVRRGLYLAHGSLCIRLAWVDGESLLAVVSRADVAEQARLGTAVGATLAAIARARLFHRDGKLSNFIVDASGAIVAIDPVGVRRSRDPKNEAQRMLERLGCEWRSEDRARYDAFLQAARSTFSNG